MRVHIEHASRVPVTGRLMQIAGALDIPDPAASTFTASVELPIEHQAWQVGAIIGPSGSGKTSVARQVWPEQLAAAPDWPAGVAIADAFPAGMTASQVTALLGRVGLGSVPTWQRPYEVLSNGERFRADMARLLADHPDLVVVDEFTSLVDRTVAKATSHAVQRAIRAAPGRQLVAITCHYDVVDWLQPDWVVDMATSRFQWRSVQPRPALHLDIHQARLGDWDIFRPHHYLNHNDLRPAASRHLYIGYIEDSPAVFFALAKFPHPTVDDLFMGSRLVVAPDFQGFGLGLRLAEWVAQRYAVGGFRVRIPTSHPSLVHTLARSPRWSLTSRPARSPKRDSPVRTDHRPDNQLTFGKAATAPWRQLRMRIFEYCPQPYPTGPRSTWAATASSTSTAS